MHDRLKVEFLSMDASIWIYGTVNAQMFIAPKKKEYARLLKGINFADGDKFYKFNGCFPNRLLALYFSNLSLQQMSLVVRKPVFGISDQVRHKPGCKTTEDG